MAAASRSCVQARAALATLFGTPANQATRRQRIALIGLRGAGKSTLGRMLAESWQVPFVELNRSIERLAGCSLAEIHSLYGPAAYRRYEQRALEETIRRFPKAVIATPGGIVSDPATFNLLLAQCFTVWLRATPEEHMRRVARAGRHCGRWPATPAMRGDGRPAPHPRRPGRVLCQGGRGVRHQRPHDSSSRSPACGPQLEPVTRIGGAERIA